MNRNLFSDFSRKSVGSVCALFLVSGALLLPVRSQAASATLTDGNSVASVDLDSSAGMNYWSVDGQNQLNQQWFWFRVGSGLQAPINTIGPANVVTAGANAVASTYANGQLTLQISYLLTGGIGGSGQADILESITVVNNTSSSMNFHFYQYSDFNLLGTGNDSILISGDPINGFDYAYQSKGLTQIAEAINSPVANHAETGLVPATLNRLNGTSDLVLNDSTSSGPGDVAWALQWDVTIAAGASFDIFKDKKLSIVPIPEPSVLAFIALGLGAWCLPRRRQS